MQDKDKNVIFRVLVLGVGIETSKKSFLEGAHCRLFRHKKMAESIFQYFFWIEFSRETPGESFKLYNVIIRHFNHNTMQDKDKNVIFRVLVLGVGLETSKKCFLEGAHCRLFRQKKSAESIFQYFFWFEFSLETPGESLKLYNVIIRRFNLNIMETIDENSNFWEFVKFFRISNIVQNDRILRSHHVRKNRKKK